MTRTRVIVVGAAACMFSVAPAALVSAEQSSPPTTIDVKTSTEASEVQRPVTSVESHEVDTDDDDSDKTGLWGLLGLLGLAGLAGLKKRRDDSTYASGTVRGDTTPRGSTGTSTKP